MGRESKKTRVKRQYLLQYALISILPVLFLSAVFLFLHALRMKDDIDHSVLLKLDQVQNRIDYNLQTMDMVGMHFAGKLGLIEEYRKSGYNGISPQLKLYQDTVRMAEDIIVYLRGEDIFFNADGEMRYQSVERLVGEENSLTMSRFFTSINQEMNAIIPIVRPYPDNERRGSMIVYKLAVPNLEQSPVASMLFTIRPSAILDTVLDFFGDFQGYAFVFDQNLNLIYDHDNCGLLDSGSLAKVSAQLKGTGILHRVVQGQRLVLARAVSENLGFTYVIGMPYGVFYGKVSSALGSFPLWVASTILLLVLAAFLLSSRNYRPIQKLLNNFNELAGNRPCQSDGKTDEFDQLQDIYHTIKTRDHQLSSQVNHQKSYVRERVLFKLLQGDVKDIEYHLIYTDLRFAYERFFVVVLGFGTSLDELEDIDSTPDLAQEMELDGGRAYRMELYGEQMIAFIVNAAGALNEKRRHSMACALYERFGKEPGYRMMAGVGNAYQGLQSVHSSFIEAVTALKAIIDNDAAPIRLFSEEPRENAEGPFVSAAHAAAFLQSLLDGNEALALEALHGMIGEIAERASSFWIMQCLCADIVGSMMKAARTLGVKLSRADVEGTLFYATVGDFRGKAERLISRICAKVEEEQKGYHELSGEDILQYVNRFYTDDSLSLTQVSERFKVSSRFVSSFFKEQAGCTFLQYITGLRMGYIKEQLRTTDTPVNEIVKSAGYLDVSNFIRRFKSIEGVTPGQYRRIHDYSA